MSDEQTFIDLREIAGENNAPVIRTKNVLTKEEDEPLGDDVTLLPVDEFAGEVPAICDNMMERHKIICRLHVNGSKRKEIADIVGCDPVTVTNTLKSPQGRAYRNYLSGQMDNIFLDVGTMIQMNSIKSLARIAAVIHDDSADKKLQIQCAWDLLDRAGHSPVKQVKMNLKQEEPITKEDIANLSKADKFLADMSGEKPPTV